MNTISHVGQHTAQAENIANVNTLQEQGAAVPHLMDGQEGGHLAVLQGGPTSAH
jgi:hypothetical protein